MYYYTSTRNSTTNYISKRKFFMLLIIKKIDDNNGNSVQYSLWTFLLSSIFNRKKFVTESFFDFTFSSDLHVLLAKDAKKICFHRMSVCLCVSVYVSLCRPSIIKKFMRKKIHTNTWNESNFLWIFLVAPLFWKYSTKRGRCNSDFCYYTIWL